MCIKQGQKRPQGNASTKRLCKVYNRQNGIKKGSLRMQNFTFGGRYCLKITEYDILQK